MSARRFEELAAKLGRPDLTANTNMDPQQWAENVLELIVVALEKLEAEKSVKR